MLEIVQVLLILIVISSKKKGLLMNTKMFLYGVVVVCFVIAGILDLKGGNYKEGVVALIFGLVNGIIFFWR